MKNFQALIYFQRNYGERFINQSKHSKICTKIYFDEHSRSNVLFIRLLASQRDVGEQLPLDKIKSAAIVRDTMPAGPNRTEALGQSSVDRGEVRGMEFA